MLILDESLASFEHGEVLLLVLGVTALFLGRKLFWLMLGGLGFLLGLSWATRFLSAQPVWLELLLALAVALIAAVVAVVLQKVAVFLAGFLVGGYGLVWLLERLGLHLGRWEWLILLAAAILVAILALRLFEAGLILLSALVGATLVLEASGLDGLAGVLLFMVLLLLGITVQLRMAKATPKAV